MEQDVDMAKMAFLPQTSAVTLTVVVTALAACQARLDNRPSAQAVQREAGRRVVGWRGVVATIAEDDSLRSHVLGQVCAGDAEWLTVARNMFPTSYAHLNEELSSAVAAALLRSPTEVLRRFGSDMCHEPDHLPSACDVSRWSERVRTSLAGVQDPNVAEVKIKCEQVLRAGL